MRAMPRTAWTLFLGAFVNRLGTFVLPFLTLYLTEHGYSKVQAGLGIAAYGMGAIASQGFGGTLADRLGRRNTIAFSMFTGAGLTVLLPEVSGLPAILGVVGLLGMMAEIYRPAASALLADVVDAKHRVAHHRRDPDPELGVPPHGGLRRRLHHYRYAERAGGPHAHPGGLGGLRLRG